MKYALVTGASRGLGAGFVEYLSTHGYFVFAGVRKISPQLISSDTVEYVPCDVSDDAQIAACVNLISQKTVHLDLLVNNVGVNGHTATSGHKELVSNLGTLYRQSLLAMFDLNAVAPLLMTQAFLPLLASGPSFVLNISSSRASYHDEYADEVANYGYDASKAALNMFTYRSLVDLPKNIRTVAVDPGDVESGMNPEGEQKPLDQAAKIMAIVDNWRDEYNGRFLRWSGEYYPL